MRFKRHCGVIYLIVDSNVSRAVIRIFEIIPYDFSLIEVDMIWVLQKCYFSFRYKLYSTVGSSEIEMFTEQVNYRICYNTFVVNNICLNSPRWEYNNKLKMIYPIDNLKRDSSAL